MKIALKLTAAMCVAAAAVSSQAADFYAGASVGPSRLRLDEPTFSVDKTDVGAKIFGGITLHPNIGVELGYARLGKAEFSGAGTGDVKGRGVFIDAVGQWPVGQNVSLLGRIGAFHGKAKGTVTGLGTADDSGTDFKFGVGAAYAFNPATSFRVEWERYRFDVFGDRSDVDMVSAGIAFKF